MTKNFVTMTISLLLIAITFVPMTTAFADAAGSASESTSIPVSYDDDIFTWDDLNPNAVRDFFGKHLSEKENVSIADEDVPLSAAPSNNFTIVYDDDLFMWDDNAETMKQIAAWANDIF